MSEDPVDSRQADAYSAAALLAQTGAAERAHHRRVRAAADHFHLSVDSRVDDRTAAALDRVMRDTVATVQRSVRDHAVRVLGMRGETTLANGLRAADDCFDRVHDAGLFRDPALFGELLGRVRLDILTNLLPIQPQPSPDHPSLLAKLAQRGDRLVASAAVALLAAQGRRDSSSDQRTAAAELPRPMHARVAWWVAAALRDALHGVALDRIALLDAALSESVRRGLDVLDELPPLEVAAMRLAHALDPQPGELSPLLDESLADGRLALFVALIARASGLGFDRVRDIVLDPDGNRLWLALRGLDIDRDTVARTAFFLAEADPARDIHGFADRIDAIMQVTPDTARVTMAPMALDPDYHAAMLALGVRE